MCRTRWSPLLPLLFFWTAAAFAATPDPAKIQAEIAAAKLETSRAVSLKNVKLAMGPGTLRLDDGVLIPTAEVAGKTSSTVRGNIFVKGESTELSIDVEHEPKAFWLDRKAKVFGRFFDENRHPKRMLTLQGVKAAAAGRLDEAAAFYEKALATEEPPPDTGETVYYQNLQLAQRVMNARIELARARLLLERGRDEEAADALDRAERMYENAEELKILQARIDVRRGDYPKAFQRLKKRLWAGNLYSSEGYALLAIAARETGNTVELELALKKARASGADVDALSGPVSASAKATSGS